MHRNNSSKQIPLYENLHPNEAQKPFEREKKFTLQQAEKSGQRLYQNYERQQMKKEILKRQREQEIAASMRQKP